MIRIKSWKKPRHRVRSSAYYIKQMGERLTAERKRKEREGTCIAELEQEVKKWKLEVTKWQDINSYIESENEDLKTALSEVREVWAGSDGGEPVTCQEAYFNRLVHQCYQIAVKALGDT